MSTNKSMNSLWFNFKHLCSCNYLNQDSSLTHPPMIPEQPLSINLPALHSTPCAQCQHGEESIDKEFDPGVICLHYTIFSRTMTFSLLSHHKTFKCSQVWHSVWGAQSVWARNVMCGRGEGGSLHTWPCVQSRIKLVERLMNKYLHSLAQKREILEYSNVNDNVNVPIMSGNERETNIRHLLPAGAREV